MAKESVSKDYHDYVIKDAKFVGEFDDMYKNAANPWHQSTAEMQENSYSKNIANLYIKRFKIESLYEIGCGLGYYTNFIKKTLPDVDITGIDISSTAIAKAKENFPYLNFEIGNALEIERYSSKQAILFAQIEWYILNDLDEILRRMLQYMEGKYFISTTTFYPKGVQKYGAEFYTTPQEYIDYMPFENLSHSVTYAEDGLIWASFIFKIKKKS